MPRALDSKPFMSPKQASGYLRDIRAPYEIHVQAAVPGRHVFVRVTRVEARRLLKRLDNSNCKVCLKDTGTIIHLEFMESEY